MGELAQQITDLKENWEAVRKNVIAAPQQNLWVAEVGLRQMIRSVLSG